MSEHFQAIDPSDGRVGTIWPRTSAQASAAALAAAVRAQASWARARVDERTAILARLGEVLAVRRETLAQTISSEMGKPIAQSLAEIDKSADACAVVAHSARDWLAPEHVHAPGLHVELHPQAIGVVLAVMPWNFPIWQVIRALAPALALGNAVLVKHAPSVPACAEALCACAEEAGVPQGLIANLRVGVEEVPALIRAPEIAAVTLTGSVGAGRAVAAIAGGALKPCVLELGGSDAYVVLSDADVAHAAAQCVASRMNNAGQSCIAAKRFFVTRPNAREFQEAVVAAMRAYVPGHPRDPATTLGPLARVDLRDALAAQVERSTRAGARVLLGATVPQGPGAWYAPTVLADVRPGMPAFDDELFGPVASIVVADSDDDALGLAGRSRFGLGGAIFSRDVARARAFALTQMSTGMVAIDQVLRSDVRVPFGGIKESGFGRELGREGLRALANLKAVYIPVRAPH